MLNGKMRAQRILGITLIVVAFVFLFGFIVLPVIPQLASSSVFDGILGGVLCSPDQTLVRNPYSQTFGSETNYSMEVYCQDANGETTNVTGKWGQIGLVGYLVLFLPGMYITTGTLDRGRKRKSTSQGSDKAYQVTPDQVDAYEKKIHSWYGSNSDLSSGRSSDLSGNHANGNGDFSDRLKEIQEAHDNGLITDEEYDQMRQKIMGEME